MNILVVGGAGYIGSHMVKLLLDSQSQVVTLDNLSNGHADAVLGGKLVQGDLSNRALLDELFKTHSFDGVMHFASFIQVGESVRDPSIYYANNVSCTLNLLDAMRRHNVRNFVFSSTAAIFGEPQRTPIDEEHPKNPINPYGRSKWMVEQVLEDYERAYGIKSVCLRYFNAAGAHPAGILGERHNPETHLIPLVLQVASGKRPFIDVYGRDYDTPDGTAIRDYIHVSDLCDAHLLAIRKLLSGGENAAYNLGNGNGFSVLEVIAAVENVTGKNVTVRHSPRRPGDSARLVADSALARSKLGWNPKYASLETIIEHAWQWEKSHISFHK
ncbi:MAG TPA: UDP-glucose 4-epimerase GalE [Burkholderiales bacterium]|nr:UDP-glucose 4-epimerase GalE [Burkholderiales bacterium]